MFRTVFSHTTTGALEPILGARLQIPEDIAVIGCGNLHYDRLLRVLLQPGPELPGIGDRTAEILLAILPSKDRPQPMKIILEPSLVARTSSPRRAGRNAHGRHSMPANSGRTTLAGSKGRIR